MTSLPSILIAGSGLSPLAAGLSLALPLLLPILLPFSWERWKGKGEYGVLYLDPTAAIRDSFGLVLQLGELWHSLVGSGHDLFHITGSKELQTCSPVHKYSECYFFLNGIFFLIFLQWLEIARAQEKKRIVGEPNSLGQAVVHMYRKLNAEITACEAVKKVTGL